MGLVLERASPVRAGLGLKARQVAVQPLLRGGTQFVAMVRAAGQQKQRPQLVAAITRARQQGTVRLVAKPDCCAELMESRARFSAVDLPAADRFILYILAAVAQ